MSISSEILRIKQAKEAIKQAIQNKGVSVSDTARLSDYALYIDNMTVGGGDSGEHTWPDFFDRRTKNITDCMYLFANIIIYEAETECKETIENFDTSKVLGFDSVFASFNKQSASATTSTIKELDLTKWNVSKGLSFEETFASCVLDNLNISGWDFSSNAQTSYLSLFYGSYIKEINMTNCNTSAVKTFYRFAYQSTELVTINMTGCDTSAATSLNSMFGSCSKLTTVIGEIDASNVTSGLYSSSGNPFGKSPLLETLYIKNIYKNVTTMKNESKWSINLGDTKIKDECLVYIINELPDLINDKGLTATDKIIFTLPPTNTLTAEQVQVAIDKGWTVANTTYEVSE